MPPIRATNRAHAGVRAIALALGLAVAACSSPLGAQAPAVKASRTEERLTHDGRERSYLVHDFSRARPAPLVIVMHGGGGTAANAVRMTGFDRVGAREGLLVVYPNGTNGRDRDALFTWNAGHCCASAMEEKVDDVGFVEALVKKLVASGRADATRVYATGMSNGAMMSHRLGRELSTTFAAIAPVVGAVFGDEPAPSAPVPAIVIVGAEDQAVPPGGGSLRSRPLLGARSAADRHVAPAMEQATYWARHNRCADPTRTRTSVVDTRRWTRCESGAPVVFHSVADNGHAWPGGQPGFFGAARPTRAFDATDVIWTFFKEQGRQTRNP